MSGDDQAVHCFLVRLCRSVALPPSQRSCNARGPACILPSKGKDLPVLYSRACSHFSSRGGGCHRDGGRERGEAAAGAARDRGAGRRGRGRRGARRAARAGVPAAPKCLFSFFFCDLRGLGSTVGKVARVPQERPCRA